MILKTADSKKDIFYLINKYSRVISRVEAEMLLEFLFNCEKLDLYVRDFIINKTVEELYDMLASRRLNGESVQRVTGRAEFMGLDFIVTKDVLIPRPETEILVNEILGAGFIAPKILDLCTGSGNIAISLAKSMPQAEIIATDISENALKIAEKNAALHQASAGIKFYKGNLFNALMFATFGGNLSDYSRLSINTDAKHKGVEKNPKFDIIVCNPPYIKEADIPFLQKEVRLEPLIALNGGKDGLDFYRDIAKESRKFLRKGAGILLEMGFGQREAVIAIFNITGKFKIDKIVKDFSGIERVLKISQL